MYDRVADRSLAIEGYDLTHQEDTSSGFTRATTTVTLRGGGHSGNGEDVTYDAEDTRPVLAGHEDRVSWDYPITGIESIAALPVDPEWLNCKPSRFGTVESLLESLAYCEANDISLYGGGQFELAVGRGQIQALALLCYPDAPNDVAPGGYNAPEPQSGLPGSPLTPPEKPSGFGGRCPRGGTLSRT